MLNKAPGSKMDLQRQLCPDISLCDIFHNNALHRTLGSSIPAKSVGQEDTTQQAEAWVEALQRIDLAQAILCDGEGLDWDGISEHCSWRSIGRPVLRTGPMPHPEYWRILRICGRNVCPRLHVWEGHRRGKSGAADGRDFCVTLTLGMKFLFVFVKAKKVRDRHCGSNGYTFGSDIEAFTRQFSLLNRLHCETDNSSKRQPF